MNTEQEQFARIVAQQQQITALHSMLSSLRRTHADALGEDTCAAIDAALASSESLGRIKFEDAVAEAIEPRVALHREELEQKHAAELKEREDQLQAVMGRLGADDKELTTRGDRK